MNSKNLLIVAYYFPPSGGPGVQRVLKMVKYLPQFGWNPIVLTVENGTFPARDESLLASIPPQTIVERTHIYEPYDLYKMFVGEKHNKAIDVSVLTKEGDAGWKKKIANWIRATFFIPDARIGWMLSAVKAGKRLIEKHNIDAIYSSSPPYTCSLIARQLKRSTQLPWIAGLRDPWTEFLTTPERWWLPSIIDKQLEHSVLKEADIIECAWQGIISDAVRKHPHLDPTKFIHIPNGFDSDEFPQIEHVANEQFTITYSGSLYGLRNPDTLIEAVSELIGEGMIEKESIKLRCVGRVGDDVRLKFQSSIIKDCVEIIEYLPHRESVAYLMRSDALLLIVDDAKESEAIVPGKVYEYLGVMKPVIALAPLQSAVASLIRETNAGEIVESGNVEACKKVVLSFFTKWKQSVELYTPREEAINKYERREAARALAQKLDGLADSKRGIS